MGKQALQIDNANLKFFTLPGYGAMSYAGSDPYKYSFFFPKLKETLELVNKYFNPYGEPITTLDMVTGPAESSSSGYSGGVSAGEDEDVWGDTGGGYYYEDDSDYSGGESGGDYSGGGEAATKSRITAAEITRAAQPAAVRPAAKAAVNPAARAADRSRAAKPAAVRPAATIRAARPAVRPAAKAAAR